MAYTVPGAVLSTWHLLLHADLIITPSRENWGLKSLSGPPNLWEAKWTYSGGRSPDQSVWVSTVRKIMGGVLLGCSRLKKKEEGEKKEK